MPCICLVANSPKSNLLLYGLCRLQLHLLEKIQPWSHLLNAANVSAENKGRAVMKKNIHGMTTYELHAVVQR